MARRIAAFLAGYAAFILLLAEFGQTLLDSLWAGLTAVGGGLAGFATTLVEAALASATGAPVEPVLTVALVLTGLGFTTFVRYVLWPLIAESSAERSDHPPRPKAPAGDVVALPSRDRPKHATDERPAA